MVKWTLEMVQKRIKNTVKALEENKEDREYYESLVKSGEWERLSRSEKKEYQWKQDSEYKIRTELKSLEIKEKHLSEGIKPHPDLLMNWKK